MGETQKHISQDSEYQGTQGFNILRPAEFQELHEVLSSATADNPKEKSELEDAQSILASYGTTSSRINKAGLDILNREMTKRGKGDVVPKIKTRLGIE